MSDSGDVFDLQDLRSLAGRGGGGLRGRSVAVGIVIAILGVSLALALVPHTLGAVGSDAVDTGDDLRSQSQTGEDAQQQYQNYLTNFSLLFAPLILVTVAVVAAFAGGLYASGSRLSRVAMVSIAAGVGVALGYVLFVTVVHVAYGETAEGFIVQEYPVTLKFGVMAVNALSLSVTAAVGSVPAGIAGALIAPSDEPAPGAASGADEPTPVAADGAKEPTGVAAADEDAAGSDGERTWEGVEGDGTTEGDAAEATADESDEPAPVDGTDRASDYQETGPQGDSESPRYDPDDRDWDGSGGD